MALVEFQALCGGVSRIYGPCALVLGWLGMYFPQAHSRYALRICFNLSFIYCRATFLKASEKTLLAFFGSWNRSHFNLSTLQPIQSGGLLLLMLPYSNRISHTWWLATLMFWFTRANNIIVEDYRPTHFCQQMGYNQQLPKIMGSRPLETVSLAEPNVYRRECIGYQTTPWRFPPCIWCGK